MTPHANLYRTAVGSAMTRLPVERSRDSFTLIALGGRSLRKQWQTPLRPRLHSVSKPIPYSLYAM